MQPLSLSPLLLLLLLLASGASATAVHEVAISVRSVRSVTYLGTQVSIFQHVSTPLRYFFQPLSFFDAESVRLESDEELSVTRLHFDVFMWTDEFLQLVRSHFPSAESVELMPLTQIRLSWSRQAAQWLGDGFNETWRLLDAWKDADKPQMRTTFTVACDTEAACGRLQRRLNGSREVAESLFDLQYRVPHVTSRNVSLAVRSRHLLESLTFQQLQLFASRHSGTRRLLVTDATVDEVAEETFTAAVAELQEQLRQDVESVDASSRHAASRRLQLQLRADAVESPTLGEWSSEVFWPQAKRYLRPDLLAKAMNRLLAPAPRPLTVRLSNNSATVRDQIQKFFPSPEGDTIVNFVNLHTPSRPHETPPPIDVADVRRLAVAVGSCVAWDAAGQRFVAASRQPLFRVDLTALAARGLLLLQPAVVELRTSQHADRLLQLRRPQEFNAGAGCSAQVDILQQRVQRLQFNVTRLATAVGRNAEKLEEWINVFAPAAGRVQQRSADSQQQLRFLQRRVAELTASLATVVGVNASLRWQPKIADSFCVLADRRDPPGLVCRDLGFFIPYKSLRYSPLLDRRVRVVTNTIGQSSFVRIDDKFFKLRLRICCT